MPGTVGEQFMCWFVHPRASPEKSLLLTVTLVLAVRKLVLRGVKSLAQDVPSSE